MLPSASGGSRRMANFTIHGTTGRQACCELEHRKQISHHYIFHGINDAGDGGKVNQIKGDLDEESEKLG